MVGKKKSFGGVVAHETVGQRGSVEESDKGLRTLPLG